MCKESWCVRLWQKRVSLGWGNCLKYLKRGWNRKEWRRNEDLKRRGQAGSRDGCLKKRGEGVLQPPYELKLIYRSWYMKKFVPNFILKYTVHFWVEPKKIANSD